MSVAASGVAGPIFAVITPGRADNLPVMSETIQPTETKPRYTWPWFLAAAVVLGVVIAVFAVKREADRVRMQKELQQQFPGNAGDK